MAVEHEVLVEQLTRLQLTCIRDQLDTLLDEAAMPATAGRGHPSPPPISRTARPRDRRVEFLVGEQPAPEPLSQIPGCPRRTDLRRQQRLPISSRTAAATTPACGCPSWPSAAPASWCRPGPS